MAALARGPFIIASKIRWLEERCNGHSYSNTGKESEGLDRYLYAGYNNKRLWVSYGHLA